MRRFFSREAIIAPPGFNRWKVPPASVAIHLCIGSVYAWSVLNLPLVRVEGVVASASSDWTLAQVVWIFSVAIAFLGLSAALGGRWLEKVGPRGIGCVAALCWGGGFLVGAIGIWAHQLWLVYLGYGVIGGCGLGLGYVSPVSTLIKWFPDRRGMAAGIAIMGFGGGAMIGAPLKEYLVESFYEAPHYLGTVSEVTLVTALGTRHAMVDGELKEVLVIGSRDVAQMIVPGPEGVYVVGTGCVGVAETFLTLGLLYFIVMVIAALGYRLPAAGWRPKGWDPGSPASVARSMITTGDVEVHEAMKTPQFYLLWIVLCLNVTAGIGVLGVAKTMISEIFGSVLPDIVDLEFCATYVLMISLFNMAGRFFWASVSDYIGRKNTFTIFFVLSIALYLSIPVSAQAVSASPEVVWLVVFYGATMLIFTMYGGAFATIPAYLADLFGTKYVGAVHGRLLTAWSAAGILGPLAITMLRESSRLAAIRDLASGVDAVAFERQFGAGIQQLEALIQNKAVTIARLMELMPEGTSDPSSGLYNSTMYLMAALLTIALGANLLVRPVHARHHAQLEAP